MVAPYYTVLVGALGVITPLWVAYLLALLLAADQAIKRENKARVARDPNRRGTVAAPNLRIAIVVPAHDEALVLGATLDSLAAQEYPMDRFEIVVVADNCSDETAAIARGRGARVLERTDAAQRGKGWALAWAFARLLADPHPADAFVIVDADTFVAPNFLRIMARRLQARQDAQGRCALQGRYGVLNRREGWRAALMDSAFDLHNHVKPLGFDRLGLSVGLKGNGMIFSRALLEQARWHGDSVTEDVDYGLDLLQHHGVRVGYVPQACVLAQMPVTADQATSQRARWEQGRYRLLRQRGVPLFWTGLRRRESHLCVAAADLCAPPLAELAALLLLWGVAIALGHAAGWLREPAWWYGTWAVTLLGFVVYVVGGLRVAGAPREAYFALLKAPVYGAWKFALYGAQIMARARRRFTANGATDSTPEWVRTARRPLTASVGAPEKVADDEAAGHVQKAAAP